MLDSSYHYRTTGKGTNAYNTMSHTVSQSSSRLLFQSQSIPQSLKSITS